MSKRRFSDVATTIFRAHDYRHLQKRPSCCAHTTLGSVPISNSYSDDGVRQGVPTMVTGAACPPVDDLIRNNMPADPFWQPDFVSQRNESSPSRSVSSKSKLDLSSTLPSLAASPALSPKGSVFFLRSDAESLHDALTVSSYDNDYPPPPMSTPAASKTFASSSKQPTSTVSPTRLSACTETREGASTMAAPTLTSSPSSINGLTESLPRRPARPGRPTLTRLNTSEIMRTHTNTAALEPPSVHSIPSRRSPTALKLQLDTSVPRRSATLSSYPHCKKMNYPTPLYSTLTLPSPTTSTRSDFATIKDGSARLTNGDVEDRAGAGESSYANSPAARPDSVNLAGDNFSFEGIDFEVSTILPDFLYLGPDVQSEQAVTELKAMGVRRILNVACEIDDRGPLRLRDRFDRYLKVPMLDSVEAKGVQDSIEQACSFLDDARLRSEPVYVHCKAGKSRSVTIVIAYLIHALGWTLRRSYSHVSEKRAAICPNIGFVAELMQFEEKELKLARSTGIYGDPADVPLASASSPQLLPGWQQGQTRLDSPRNDSSPIPSTLARQGVLMHMTTSLNSSLGGSLSKSSPDLPSLTSGCT